MANKAIKTGQFLSILKILRDRGISLAVRGKSLPAITVFIACLVLICSTLPQTTASPLPAPGSLLLSGVERNYKTEREKVNADAEAERQQVKNSSGVLTSGVLGLKAQTLKNVPVTKELVKSDGVVDKATGTGPVLMDKEKAKKKGKAPPPEEDEDEDEEKDKDKDPQVGAGALSGGLSSLADLGKDQGKEFKIAPK